MVVILISLHLVVLKLGDGDVAVLVHHRLALGDHVPEYHVCCLVALSPLLQLSTFLGELIDLVQLSIPVSYTHLTLPTICSV